MEDNGNKPPVPEGWEFLFPFTDLSKVHQIPLSAPLIFWFDDPSKGAVIFYPPMNQN